MSSPVATRRPTKPEKSPAFRMATPLALAVSILIHLGLFLFIGSAVIFEGKIPPTFFQAFGDPQTEPYQAAQAPPLMEDKPLPDTIDSPLEDPVADPMENLSDLPASDIITSSRMDTSLSPASPLRSLSVAPKLNTPLDTPEVKMKREESTAKKGPGVPRTANLFGRVVQAKRLGVILDVSYSTHGIIDQAIEEIEDSFPNCILVFTPGCALNTRPGEVLPVSEFEKGVDRYGVDDPEDFDELFTTPGFIEKLLDRNRDFRDIWDDVGHEGRGYVVFTEGSFRREKNAITGIGGVKQAMEFLEDMDVDVIYWFADFGDAAQMPTVVEIANDLRRAEIKALLHDFAAPLGTGNPRTRPEVKKRIVDAMNLLAGETGGEVFLVEQ